MSLRGVRLDRPGVALVVAGVVLGLVVGKPVGILVASFVAVRLGLGALPAGVSWRGMLLLGSVAGIGFTMALFVAGLAFSDPAALGTARLAVLLALGVAGSLAMLVGRLTRPAVSGADHLDPLERFAKGFERKVGGAFGARPPSPPHAGGEARGRRGGAAGREPFAG